MFNDGIMEPLDGIDGKARKGLARKELFVRPGTAIEHTPSGIRGQVVSFVEGVKIVLRDPLGEEHGFDPVPGLFRHEGVLVELRQTLSPKVDLAPKVTASGSIAATDTTAKVARAGRIYVEGIHDAELIERVWGDDLRYVGVVVEQLEGADDLAAHVTEFAPGPGRHLGILLDHLVDGSKESRIVEGWDGSDTSSPPASIARFRPHLMVRGHPFVDIWQAIKPEAAGIAAWPSVPKGEPWKEGVMKRLGVDTHPAQFWKFLLGRVGSWKDLERPLVRSVEELIDFVTIDEAG